MKLVVVFTICLAGLFSCTPERTEEEGGICSTLFAEFKVHAIQNGQPAIFDSTYVIRKSTGQKIVHPTQSYPPGNYTVLNDTYKSMTPDSFTIYGYQSGIKKLQRSYYIVSDVCHILHGRDTVVIP